MALRRVDPTTQQLEEMGMSRASAALLSRTGTLLDLRAGTTLCTEGERGLEAFLVLEGEADVLTGDGVIKVGAGAVIGELATLDPRRTRNATVVAHTDLVVLVFDVRTFRSLASKADLRGRLAPERAAA